MNVGPMLKGISVICAVLVAVGGILFAFVYSSVFGTFPTIVSCIASIFIAILSYVLLYGFGDLIDTEHQILDKLNDK